MRRSLFLLLALTALLPALGQEDQPARLKIRVVDQEGVPVSRARVVLSTYAAWIPGRQADGAEYATAQGSTDGNGEVALTLKGSSGRYSCMVLPMPDFQMHRGKDYVFTNSVASRWEPWEAPLTITLKRKATAYTSLEALAPESVAAPQTNSATVSKDPLVAAPKDVNSGGRP